MAPRLIRSRIARSRYCQEPRSRTVVTPVSSVLRAFSCARKAVTAGESVPELRPGTCAGLAVPVERHVRVGVDQSRNARQRPQVDDRALRPAPRHRPAPTFVTRSPSTTTTASRTTSPGPLTREPNRIAVSSAARASTVGSPRTRTKSRRGPRLPMFRVLKGHTVHAFGARPRRLTPSRPSALPAEGRSLGSALLLSSLLPLLDRPGMAGVRQDP